MLLDSKFHISDKLLYHSMNGTSLFLHKSEVKPKTSVNIWLLITEGLLWYSSFYFMTTHLCGLISFVTVIYKHVSSTTNRCKVIYFGTLILHFYWFWCLLTFMVLPTGWWLPGSSYQTQWYCSYHHPNWMLYFYVWLYCNRRDTV